MHELLHTLRARLSLLRMKARLMAPDVPSAITREMQEITKLLRDDYCVEIDDEQAPDSPIAMIHRADARSDSVPDPEDWPRVRLWLLQHALRHTDFSRVGDPLSIADEALACVDRIVDRLRDERGRSRAA